MNADPQATEKQCRAFFLLASRALGPRRAAQRTHEHARRLGLPARAARETVLAVLWDLEPELAEEMDPTTH